MLILTEYIAKHEFKPLLKHLTLDDILEGGRKVQKNLAQELRPIHSSAGNRFYKVRIGARVHARMIVFMITENRKVVPLLIRLKSDAVFGINMAMNNPAVVDQVEKNFKRVREDIESGRFQGFDLSC